MTINSSSTNTILLPTGGLSTLRCSSIHFWKFSAFDAMRLVYRREILLEELRRRVLACAPAPRPLSARPPAREPALPLRDRPAASGDRGDPRGHGGHDGGEERERGGELGGH